MSFESPTKEKDPILGEERETDVSGIIDELEKKDPTVRGKSTPHNAEETAPQVALTDRMIEMIQERMEKEGIESDEAIRQLQSEGAFEDQPEMSLEKMVEELNRELEEKEEDGVAA